MVWKRNSKLSDYSYLSIQEGCCQDMNHPIPRPHIKTYRFLVKNVIINSESRVVHPKFHVHLSEVHDYGKWRGQSSVLYVKYKVSDT